MTREQALRELSICLQGHDAAARAVDRQPGSWVPVRRTALAAVVATYYSDVPDPVTPPRPQDVSGSDYAEDDWQSLLGSPE